MTLRAAARRLGVNLLRATDGRDVLHNSPDGWEVEQPWLWWTGPANGGGTVGPFGHPIPGAEPWAGWASIPAVARATSLVCDVLAALPWRVQRGRDVLPSPGWIADPQALRVDGRVVGAGAVADSRWSWMDFWTQWVTSAFWFGDGYIWAPMRDKSGGPLPPMWVLNPADIKIDAGAYWVDGDREPLDASLLIHLRGMAPITGGHGSGLFTRFAAELGYTQTLRDYANGVFYNGVPAGYLKANAPTVTQDQADALKAKWMAAHGGRTKSIAVLNATTEFHPLTFTPVDTALIEAMRANLGALANAAGIPADMIGGATDANTYANIESRRMDLYTFTYIQWTKRIEAVLSAQLPAGTDLKIDLRGLLQADTATRMATYATGLDKGIYTVDEVREFEDLPPLFEPEVIG